MDNKKTTLPNGQVLTPVKPMLSEEQMHKLTQDIGYLNPQNAYKEQLNNDLINDLKNIKSPEERLEFVTKRMDSQTAILQNLQHENMKLNTQIEVMNKTIDSNNEELHNLRLTNSELKAVNKVLEENNQTLKDNNKHYWLFTFLIGTATTILGIVLGHYF